MTELRELYLSHNVIENAHGLESQVSTEDSSAAGVFVVPEIEGFCDTVPSRLDPVVHSVLLTLQYAPERNYLARQSAAITRSVVHG